MSLVLAYTPFLDPMNLHNAWWLTLVPLALGISVVYKAVRVKDFRGYWGQVVMMTVQIILGIIAISVGLFLLTEVFIPMVES